MVDLIEFYEHANRLKWTARRGWVSKVKVREPESVADHSYLTALVCMIISDMRKLNTAKVLKMALIHDLAEAITGDLMPDDLSKKSKKDQEMKAMKSILSKLPQRLRAEYEKLWREYGEMTSKEAMLVHQVDKLEMALQANDYLKKGYDYRLLEQFFRSSRNGIKDKQLLRILNSLKRTKG
jgi:putative hydrolase of HD superfamily